MRTGFTTKEGRQINCDRVEIKLGWEKLQLMQLPMVLSHKENQKLLLEPQTIDLTMETEKVKSRLVKENKVSEGFLTALCGKMLPKMEQTFTDSPTILLILLVRYSNPS